MDKQQMHAEIDRLLPMSDEDLLLEIALNLPKKPLFRLWVRGVEGERGQEFLYGHSTGVMPEWASEAIQRRHTSQAPVWYSHDLDIMTARVPQESLSDWQNFLDANGFHLLTT